MEWTAYFTEGVPHESLADLLIALDARELPHTRSGSSPTLTREDIREMIGSMDDVLRTVRGADSDAKLEVYRALGLRLTFDDETQTVLAETRPAPPVYLVNVSEGGLEPPRPIKGTSTSS